MTKILISAETRTWTTRPRDESDSWDNGDTAGEVSNVWACVEDQAEQHYYGESEVVELNVQAGDTIFAVVADYESGCTFGRDGGHAQILDAFLSSNEANACASAAMNVNANDAHSFTYNGKGYYKAWVGYFESLNSLDVWEIRVRGEYQNFLTPGTQRSYGYKRGQ
jgi:hypothetical protein